MNGVYIVLAIALDTPSGMIYWTHNDPSFLTNEPRGVRRAALNSREPEVIIVGDVCDIALANMLSKIYWTPCDSSQIRRANLDGGQVEDVITRQGVIGNLVIDHKGGRIYWTETREGNIRRANLDGSEVETLLSGLVAPTSMALNSGGMSA